jgi:hypothetical protein
VDDALTQADGQTYANQGAAPEQERCPLTVSPAGADGEDQERRTHQEGARDEP